MNQRKKIWQIIIGRILYSVNSVYINALGLFSQAPSLNPLSSILFQFVLAEMKAPVINICWLAAIFFFFDFCSRYNMIRAVVTLVWQIPTKSNADNDCTRYELKRKKTNTTNGVHTRYDEGNKESRDEEERSGKKSVAQHLVCEFVLVVYVVYGVSSGFSIKFINRSVNRCISNVIFEAATSLWLSRSLFSLYIIRELFIQWKQVQQVTHIQISFYSLFSFFFGVRWSK